MEGETQAGVSKWGARPIDGGADQEHHPLPYMLPYGSPTAVPFRHTKGAAPEEQRPADVGAGVRGDQASLGASRVTQASRRSASGRMWSVLAASWVCAN